MKVSTIAFFFLAASLASAQTRSNTSTTKQLKPEILKAERAFFEKNFIDNPNYDDLVIEGAILVQYKGRISNFMKGMNISFFIKPAQTRLHNLEIKVREKVVIVSGVYLYKFEDGDKKLVPGKENFLHIWTKIDNSWKIVLAQHLERVRYKTDPWTKSVPHGKKRSVRSDLSKADRAK